MIDVRLNGVRGWWCALWKEGKLIYKLWYGSKESSAVNDCM